MLGRNTITNHIVVAEFKLKKGEQAPQPSIEAPPDAQAPPLCEDPPTEPASAQVKQEIIDPTKSPAFPLAVGTIADLA